MSDYISRQAAIDWASKIPIHDLSDGRGFCRVIFADDFLKALKTIPLAQSHWIPCTERLPEKSGRYLVTNTRLGAFEVTENIFYNGKGEAPEGWLYEDGTIAWMPLPEPYKGEKA